MVDGKLQLVDTSVIKTGDDSLGMGYRFLTCMQHEFNACHDKSIGSFCVSIDDGVRVWRGFNF